MNKYAAWHWDGAGPEPSALGYRQVNQVNESADLSVDGHALRVATMADGLESSSHLVINVEKYGANNVPVAVRLANAARVANPSVFIGAYVSQANGDKWGLCGRLQVPRDNMLAVEQVRTTLDQLAPWVDFWLVDMHFSEKNDSAIEFWNTTARATQEIIVTQRVAMLEAYDKPWWGVMNVMAVPSRDKGRATFAGSEWVYEQAAWCRAKGADAVYVMVWDDARKKAEGVGRVACTPEIQKTLANIGKL